MTIDNWQAYLQYPRDGNGIFKIEITFSQADNINLIQFCVFNIYWEQEPNLNGRLVWDIRQFEPQ